MVDERDERLGTLINELEVPEHGPEFWAGLEQQLLVEPAKRGLAPRVPGWWRRRWWTNRIGSGRLALGGAALAALVVAIGIFAIRSATVTPETATADDVLRRAFDALGKVRSATGTLTIGAVNEEGGGKFTEHWRFAADDSGSLRFKLLTPPSGGRDDYALDGERGVSHELSISPPPYRDGSFALRTRGVPLGGPDPAVLPDVLRRDLGASVLTYLERGDASVEETSFEGRDAWRLDSAVRFGPQAGRIEAIIDQGSGLPVRIATRLEGRLVSETTLSELAFARPSPPGEFRIQFPRGVPVQRDDLGFRRVDFADASRLSGYGAPVPSFVPDGFEFDQAAVRVPRPQDRCFERCGALLFPGPTGVRARNPVAGSILALSYRQGLRQFVVTSRPTGRPELWEDPFIFDPGSVQIERITLAAGALEGARAEIVIDPLTEPHLWALGDELVVTVSGALSRDDLLRVAESLNQD